MIGEGYMKAGDIIRHSTDKAVGIIIEIIDHGEVPPAARILWQEGYVDKEWVDDIEAINKNNT